MDIKNYFKEPKLCDSFKKTSSSSIEINNTKSSESGVEGVVENASITINRKNNDVGDVMTHEKDIRKYLNDKNIDDILKFEFLHNPLIPNTNYGYKSDLKPRSTSMKNVNEIITFYFESTHQKKIKPNIPFFCETR